MTKKFVVFVLFLITCPAAWSLEAPHQSNDTSHQFFQIQRFLEQVRQNAYPELADQRLKLGQFHEADAYFQSNFNVPTLFTPAPEYVVEVNPLLWERGCPHNAIIAILAHELSHTLDYVEGGIPGIIEIGLQLAHFEGLRRYEHRTDLRAIFRGYGPGLIAYRRWIYAQLTPQQLQRKKAVYYQPHEILLIQRRLEQSTAKERQQLEKVWMKNPPMSSGEIEAALHAAT